MSSHGGSNDLAYANLLWDYNDEDYIGYVLGRATYFEGRAAAAAILYGGPEALCRRGSRRHHGARPARHRGSSGRWTRRIEPIYISIHPLQWGRAGGAQRKQWVPGGASHRAASAPADSVSSPIVNLRLKMGAIG